MSKRKAILLIVGLGLLAASAWGAEVTPRANLIHVTGRAVVKVVPDTGKVQFQVRADGQDVNGAAQEAARTMQALLDQIKAMNLPGASVDATGLSLAANYPQIKPGQPAGGVGAGGNAPPAPPQPIGFTATTVGTVLLHGDLNTLRQNVAQITAALLAVPGVTLAAAPTLYKDDPTAARQQALEAAVREAIGNAQAIAKGMGVTITGYSYATMDMTAGQAGRGGLVPQPMVYRGDFGYMAVSMGASGTMTSPATTETTELEVNVTLDAAY